MLHRVLFALSYISMLCGLHCSSEGFLYETLGSGVFVSHQSSSLEKICGLVLACLPSVKAGWHSLKVHKFHVFYYQNVNVQVDPGSNRTALWNPVADQSQKISIKSFQTMCRHYTLGIYEARATTQPLIGFIMWASKQTEIAIIKGLKRSAVWHS